MKEKAGHSIWHKSKKQEENYKMKPKLKLKTKLKGGKKW